MIELKVEKVHKDAELPEYATEGSACFDLKTIESGLVNDSHLFSTGLKFEIPNEHVMLIFSRSGMGFKDGIRLANCVGVIDSDYRGEVFVKLQSDHNKKVYEKGDRIAQALVIKYDKVAFNLVDKISSDTERGEGGFGSTGK